MKKMYIIFLMFLIGIFVGSLAKHLSQKDQKIYYVKLTFCDSREPIVVEQDFKPIKEQIQTYRQAVPIFNNLKDEYYNVCDFEIVDIKDKK